MNRDDRAALIEMGRQFTPGLFDGLDASTPDEVVLSQMGNALSFLHARAQDAAAQGPGKAEAAADEQPSAAEVEAWLAQQPLLVQRQRVQLVEQPGGRRRRVYSAYNEAATMDDVLSWRLNEPQQLLHFVLSDGQNGALPWN